MTKEEIAIKSVELAIKSGVSRLELVNLSTDICDFICGYKTTESFLTFPMDRHIEEQRPEEVSQHLSTENNGDELMEREDSPDPGILEGGAETPQGNEDDIVTEKLDIEVIDSLPPQEKTDVDQEALTPEKIEIEVINPLDPKFLPEEVKKIIIQDALSAPQETPQ